jgi:dipeptidyl aminopeptidase/acylaminoacyl peptidase
MRQRIGLAALLLAALPVSGMAGDAAGDVPELVPSFVRPLFAKAETGRNDLSPTWSPVGAMLAFERANEVRREIVIAGVDGALVRTVYYQANADDFGLAGLLPELGVSISYNSALTWSPTADRFAFMSNAGEGNYDLYLGTLIGKNIQRLTDDPQKDGQPNWSPTGNQVVFVSGRTGGAQLFLLDVDSRRTLRLSQGEKAYLYPRWSPDGRHIVAIYGENENHDIVVLDDIANPADGPTPATIGAAPTAGAAPGAAGAALPPPANPASVVGATPAPLSRPPASQRGLTAWAFDDLSPTWSPDGKRIAFYSNYNPEHDPKIWSIVVVESDRKTPATESELVARVVAHNVIPDVSVGPAWLPDSKRIAYVGNDKNDYSPIYIVDVDSRDCRRLKTGTSINRDLTVSRQGMFAFRAQVDQWDRIFLAQLSN